MKNILLSFLLLIFLASCSNNSYVNAIPGDATALMQLNTPKAFLNYKGVDVSSDVYLFEDAEGNVGACLRVSDDDALTDYLNTLAKKGTCEKVFERRGFHFSLLSNGFLAGYSDESLVILGPIVETAKAETVNKMAKMLKQDEDDGIQSSRIYEALDTLDGPVKIVARVDALPQQFVTPFMLGAPKQADASQVYLSAKMTSSKGLLRMEGHTFSFNKDIDQALQASASIYRPIKGAYTQSMPAEAMLGMFLNVDGERFINVMRDNKGLQAMLAGINRALDMDNIIKSVNGDMAIVIPEWSEDKIDLSMAAKLKHAHWLNDVSYWKTSTPSGSTITDWQKDAYCYTDGKTTFYFGVSPDMQFYSGGSKEAALNSIKPTAGSLSSDMQEAIRGQRLAMIVNLGMLSGKQGTVVQMLRPVFGNADKILFLLK